jgi:isoquinoline 1-oxidoreductase alpha subunit
VLSPVRALRLQRELASTGLLCKLSLPVARLRFTVNGIERDVEADPEMPLLWFLRDVLSLTGTKYGCGAMLCGACTVHLDGAPIRSCGTPMKAVQDKAIVTIEGLDSPAGRAVQQAWIEEQVPQCGFCQSGQILSATALLEREPDPSDAAIDQAMRGNLCRCGTYVRIRRAIRKASETRKCPPSST